MSVKDIEKYVTAAMDFYGKPAAVKLVLQAGSSVSNNLDSCLDIDLLLFVDDESSDGSIYFSFENVRVEAVVIPLSIAIEVMKRSLRAQKCSVLEMVMSGKTVFGDEDIISDLRLWILNALSSTKPLFLKEPAGFAAYSLLDALRRATRKSDMTALAFGVLEFMGKTEGPSRGEWPMSPKYLGRRFSMLEGDSSISLQISIEECVQGNKEPLIAYFNNWIAAHGLPTIKNLRMLRPTGMQA